ncbi:MAG: hypothetical protein JXA16_12495 [Bacteroidales bacterium]|nr:hypothetical protein [Bacteroidales bacterium]
MGDSFGLLNTLFSGLGLAAIIWTVFLQYKGFKSSLADMQEQLENQRFATLEAMKLNHFNILSVYGGFLGQENDNYNRLISDLKKQQKVENEEEILRLQNIIAENHKQYMRISSVFKTNTNDILHKYE